MVRRSIGNRIILLSVLPCSIEGFALISPPALTSRIHTKIHSYPGVPASDETAKYLDDAASIRLQAEKMEVELSVAKLSKLEKELERRQAGGKPKNKMLATEQVEAQIKVLKEKLQQNEEKSESAMRNNSTFSNPISIDGQNLTKATTCPASSSTAVEVSVTNTTTTTGARDEALAGFDQKDLDVYVPVAMDIEVKLKNATDEEKLEAFQSSPVLQEYFQKKITEMLVAPMQDMQELDDLKKLYLKSTSTIEKINLKRQIDALTLALETNGPIRYTESIYRGDEIPELTEEDIAVRLDAVHALPGVLQVLYKKRYDLPGEADAKLVIMLDHYEEQLQLLDQVKVLQPLTEESQAEIVQALQFLPCLVLDHLAVNFGLDIHSYTIDDLIEKLCEDVDEDGSRWSGVNPFRQVASIANNPQMAEEYEDIEFMDRSRYLSEFYPSVARMEGQHPRLETVNKFMSHAVDKKAFMIVRKPERVIGGWYIRGRNLVDENNSGVNLIRRIEEQMEQSSLVFGQEETYEYFYLQDPAPLLDEEIELEYRVDPVLLVTAKNASKFYNIANPVTKVAVSALAMSSLSYLCVYVCSLGGPAFMHQLDVASSALTTGEQADTLFLTDTISQLIFPLLFVQVAHEAGHKAVALRDKFEIGLPTLVPSILLGYAGAITPLKSPPPNMKSMFDFAIAGPLCGIAVSLAILQIGLQMTAAMNPADLPGLPMFLVRSSSLGGGLIENALGKGTIELSAEVQSSLQLHPFAIAGFVGILVNSLALLPLGNTDGGRISIAMFGRRGTYIVKTFTAVLLVGAGIFGYDEGGMLLSYTLLNLVWQKELEAPAKNEVEELDFPRGVLGIVAAVLVALVLIPM